MRLIDADVLKIRLKNRWCCDCQSKGMDYQGVRCRACAIMDELDEIDDAPTVDPVKHGHWVKHKSNIESCYIQRYDGDLVWYECSECQGRETIIKLYCPYCGAKMDEVSE